MNIFVTIFGIAAVILCIPLMVCEAKRRRENVIRRVHTTWVPLNTNLVKEEKLTGTDLIIGRTKLWSDICLEGLIINHKSRISRNHARLWWDWKGRTFRIAPVYTWKLKWGRNGKWYLPRREWSRPMVWVDEKLAPVKEGLPVKYGQIITLSRGGYEFMLVNTAEDPKDVCVHGTQPLFPRIEAALDNWYDARMEGVRRFAQKHRTALIVIAIVLVVIGVLALMVATAGTAPGPEEPDPNRKKDTATFLVCGVDADGVRTDTMILVYQSGSEGRMSLLSLPRDTISINAKGKTVKLNAIYGGRGEKGAEELLDVVARYIGYRPDGYLFFDWEMVRDITDEMDGVYVTLEHEIIQKDPFTGEKITIPAGERTHLDGSAVLAAMRHRKGYANGTDLERIEVQRLVLKSCVKQWVSLKNIGALDDVAKIVDERSVTNLEPEHLVWIAKTALKCGADIFASETLSNYEENRNGASYVVLEPWLIVEQINENFNPYKTEITRDMLEVVE